MVFAPGLLLRLLPLIQVCEVRVLQSILRADSSLGVESKHLLQEVQGVAAGAARHTLAQGDAWFASRRKVLKELRVLCSGHSVSELDLSVLLDIITRNVFLCCD